MHICVSYHTPDHDEADRLRAALSTRTPGLDFYFAPAPNSAGAYWLPTFAEEIQALLEEAKASGLVARLVERHRIRGLSVAPAG
jgi:hypothetical protein